MRLLVLFFFIFSFGYSQTNIYLDENMQDIDSTLFKIRCKNEMLKCYDISKNNGSILHVVYKKFNFGKLSDYSNQRIRKEIYRNDSFKGSVIIHYSTYLVGIDSIIKRRKIAENKRIQSNNKFKSDKKCCSSDKESIKKEGSKISKKVHKCIKKLENKFDVNVLHYYLDGNTSFTPMIMWEKDKNKIIKNYFFKYIKQYYYVIIKPDGQYLQIGSLITPKKIKKLLKNENWSKYIEDLKKSEKSRKRTGFFNMEHIHNCL